MILDDYDDFYDQYEREQERTERLRREWEREGDLIDREYERSIEEELK